MKKLLTTMVLGLVLTGCANDITKMVDDEITKTAKLLYPAKNEAAAYDANKKKNAMDQINTWLKISSHFAHVDKGLISVDINNCEVGQTDDFSYYVVKCLVIIDKRAYANQDCSVDDLETEYVYQMLGFVFLDADKDRIKQMINVNGENEILDLCKYKNNQATM